jgi:hypothetical protein
MPLNIDQLGKLVVAQLSDDLLSEQFAQMQTAERNPLFGHCYVASEALYHLAGAKKSGMRPRRLRIAENYWHWWLVDREGKVVDLTAGQFSEPPDYGSGLRTAFLSKRPSARARKLMARVLAEELRHGMSD